MKKTKKPKRSKSTEGKFENRKKAEIKPANVDIINIFPTLAKGMI